jgi:hypothetical protein
MGEGPRLLVDLYRTRFRRIEPDATLAGRRGAGSLGWFIGSELL